jgi:hypothetical protein
MIHLARTTGNCVRQQWSALIETGDRHALGFPGESP